MLIYKRDHPVNLIGFEQRHERMQSGNIIIDFNNDRDRMRLTVKSDFSYNFKRLMNS